MAKEIKFLVVSADGTLTDTIMSVSSDGSVIRNFNVIDAIAIEHFLQDKDHYVFLASRSKNTCLKNFIACYPFSLNDRFFCFDGVLDIKSEVSRILNDIGKVWGEVCFVTMSIEEMEQMQACGLTACPLDASEAVKFNSNLISYEKSGQGVVGDIIENLNNRINFLGWF